MYLGLNCVPTGEPEEVNRHPGSAGLSKNLGDLLRLMDKKISI
jgi:hypothetical protein